MTSISNLWSNKIELGSKTSILWNASALISQRLFERKPLDDKIWIVSTALTIIGFVAYQILIASWLDTSKYLVGSTRVALDDTLKFSTMFFISRLLSGQSLSDPEWIKTSGLFVGSLVTYDLLAHNIVAEKTATMDPAMATTITDVLKFGSTFAVHNFLTGGEFNNEWTMSTVGFLVGVIIYDMFISKYTYGRF